MNKAEEAALNAYPPKYKEPPRRASRVQSNRVDTHAQIRAVYINGYNQAVRDIMDKAKDWFDKNIPSKSVQFLWMDFEREMIYGESKS